MKQLLGQCQMQKKIRLKLRCDGQGIAYIRISTNAVGPLCAVPKTMQNMYECTATILITVVL